MDMNDIFSQFGDIFGDEGFGGFLVAAVQGQGHQERRDKEVATCVLN